MPIYEYECAKCGEFEATQRITDDPLKRCPKCRSKVRKLISNTSFQLKGSGWYITDYGRKEGGAGKDGEKSATESTSKGESTSSETKSSETKSSETKSSETQSSEKKPAKKASTKAEASKAA